MAKRGARWQNPLPNTAYIAFRYIDDGFSAATTALNNYQEDHVFRGNSLYDPDQTGVGVQPYGYDQWVAIYGTECSYRVTASSIAVNWCITSEAASEVKCYVIPYRNTVFDYTDESDLRTIPYCRWKQTDKTAGQTQKNWIQAYCTTRALHRNMTAKDSIFTSGSGTNPTGAWYWHVIFDTSTVSEAVTISYDIKIKYYSILSRYKDVNES